MSFDPLAAINGAVSSTVPTHASTVPTDQANGTFSRVVANTSSEAANITTQVPARAQESRPELTRVASVREYSLTSLPRNQQDGMGHHVLDRLETLYRGDQRLRQANAHGATDTPPVALAGAGLPRGPAAAPLDRAARSADSFDIMLRNFEQVYQQSIQVGLMTKSTGAFTTSMNKLMSSA
ncbi:nodulation protein NolB [Bradyrhizobium sp. LHD-71]|uniref:nodulation protein NolB n=1 Tax=Bradyrhizobium sp. LHD-71 TaxID=3072141 RepID=UPI00280C9284|nr:nodulation protein NolB [Bradyrhizobium sp. LHD-71]MDQ8726887.1 nodulation protein NolB [Bradyrhizobium sp. LHD-71]